MILSANNQRLIGEYKPEDFLILVVDDINRNLQLVVEILDGFGYSTTFANSGIQALERVKMAKPDLILLDLMMPEMNGIQVCQVLKSQQIYTDIPVIFLTASNEENDLLQAFEQGAVDYIIKPCRPSELLARVKTHLELKRTRDELKKAYQELEKLANTDPLTGLANRRALFEVCEREFERAQRYYHPFSILMLDLDHFKRINDNFGHSVGDLALRITAQTIFEQLREVDLVGRFGGEEFIIILPETQIEDAIIVAQRICRTISQLSLPVQDKTVTITVSIGVATYTNGDRNIDMIIQRADQALYKAKHKGRNRVESVSKQNCC